jgi:cell division septum initiation protein DivIVA
MYDKEKENLKARITNLTNELSASEKEKENSNDLIQSSLREVSSLYGQKVDFLQKELLDTRTEASTRLIVLTKELNKAQTLIKEQEGNVISLKQKMRDVRYHHDISQKSAGYKLEKSE